MNEFADIAGLEDLLFQVDATMSAIESHGALCGMLCASGSVEAPQWLLHVLGEQAEGQSSSALKTAAAQLMQIYQLTISQMNSSDAGLDLFLPDEDEPLEERVEALSLWCQGYVYGLAAGGIKQDTVLPEDTSELIQDIVETSRIGQDSLDDDEEEGSREEDEVAFMEVVEYVRMGVLLIYEELQPIQTSRTLH